LIQKIESLVGPPMLKSLNSNMLPETIDAREQFIALFGSRFFVTFAKRVVKGTIIIIIIISYTGLARSHAVHLCLEIKETLFI
jgi:hypothetical protein